MFNLFKKKYPIVEFGGFYPMPAQYETNLRYLCIGIHDGWICPSKRRFRNIFSIQRLF